MKKMTIPVFFSTARATSTIIILILHTIAGLAQNKEWEGTRETTKGVEYINNPEKGLWDNDPTKKIRIEKIFSLGDMEAQNEFLFSWVQYITTDEKANIYACDSRLNRIQVYNKDGKYLRTIGQSGKGPGDLLRPMKVLVGFDGNLYVDDNLNYRISVFRQDGAFKKSFRLKSFCGDMELDSSGKILVIHMFSGDDDEQSPKIVTEYSNKGRIDRKYGDRLKTIKKNNFGEPEYAYNKLLVTDKDQLLVSFSYPYMIHFYENGNLVKVVNRDSPIFTKPEITETIIELQDSQQAETVALKQRSYIWQTFILPGNRFATYIRDSGEDVNELKSMREFETYIDLFDSEGLFLKSYKWDWKKYGLIKHIDNKGFIYTNYGESEIIPGVTKWKVSFE